ncbi:MAG: hypothetical protein AB8G23_14785 [Myxococcota bacterium]
MSQPDAPPPIRRYFMPDANESWESLAQRASEQTTQAIDIPTLQSWNLHLAMRPPSITLTPTDIVFVDPPMPDLAS